MRSTVYILLAMALSACAAETATGVGGPTVTVNVAPLDLPGIDLACYDLRVDNGAAPAETVIARGDPGLRLDEGDSNTLCSTRFGNGAGGDISYVAPCDAQQSAHTITLWLDGLYTGTEAAPVLLPDYQDPCPTGCTLQAACQENADTPVTFNITVMRRAQQGFFDIGVNFDNVFCSAKLDTCYDDGTPIELLHDVNGDRQHTAVAAVACTAGPGDANTHLHMTAFVVDCGAGPQTLSFDALDREGTIAIGNLAGAVYFGTEALPNAGGPPGSANKVFTNVAFLLPESPATCSVSWTVVPTDSDVPPAPVNGQGGTFEQVAAVTFNVAGLADGSCASHPLNATDSDVTSTYLEVAPEYDASLAIRMTAFSGTSDIPAIERVVLHLDASTLTAAAGTPIDTWPNRVIGTADATQETAAARPTVSEDTITGFRMLSFDGQDDHLIVQNFPDLTSWTIAVAFRGRPAGIGQFRGLFEFAPAAQARRGIGIGTSGEPIIVFPAAYRRATSQSVLTDTMRVAIGRNDGTGASATLSLDGTLQDLLTQQGYGNATRLNQGVIGNYANFLNAYSFPGELAEIVVYDSVISDDDLSALANYLEAKWAPP